MKSIPVHLLVESQDQVVSIELSSGETYRGKLLKAEDNMNVLMSDVIATSREGSKQHLKSVFVRGSHIKMFLLPDIIKYAPALQPELVKKITMEAQTKRKESIKRAKPRRKQLKNN